MGDSVFYIAADIALFLISDFNYGLFKADCTALVKSLIF